MQRATRRAERLTSQVFDECDRGRPVNAIYTFAGTPKPDPVKDWIGQQNPHEKLPTGGKLLNNAEGFPAGLLAVEDGEKRIKILVPHAQVMRLVKYEHLALLHVGHARCDPY